MSQGLTYSLVESNTTDIPSNSGALTYNRGFNVAGGSVDEIILRVTTVNTTNAILADFSNILSSLRIILNGETVFDFRSGYASASNNAPGQAGYFLNALGPGRFIEVPSDLTKECYFRIPIGRVLPASISRMEVTLTWAATAAAVASGTVQWWLRYNQNMQTTTTVSAATSFTHAASEEQVNIRLPANVQGTLAGLMVQNDSAADELTGIRIVNQSDFSIPTQMFRAFNGDLDNGILFADDDVSTSAQQYAIQVAGGLFLPLFGLTMDAPFVLQVNSSAVTTRTYTPVITSPIAGAPVPDQRQTQPVVTNVAKSVLSATTEQS